MKLPAVCGFFCFREVKDFLQSVRASRTGKRGKCSLMFPNSIYLNSATEDSPSGNGKSVHNTMHAEAPDRDATCAISISS
jgi:hypothetical protein